MGFCKKINDTVRQLQEFSIVIEKIDRRKEEMLEKMITMSPGLRDYLIIHSVFKPEDKKDGDWFVKKMLAILSPSDSDIERIYLKSDVPKEILDKLQMFDPEPIGLEIDSVRIEYELYGKGDPINVIDTDWEKISKESASIENILLTFSNINVDAPTLSSIPGESFEND
jgi:hypothetical protein